MGLLKMKKIIFSQNYTSYFCDAIRRNIEMPYSTLHCEVSRLKFYLEKLCKVS